MPIERYRTFDWRMFYPDVGVRADFAMATKAGGFVFLRGQTGFDLEGAFHGVGDPAAQTEQACNNIRQLLAEAGLNMTDVCRITVYITDRAYRQQVYEVISRHFAGVFPCSTGLVVNGLALLEMLVEIDVVAYREDPPSSPAEDGSVPGE